MRSARFLARASSPCTSRRSPTPRATPASKCPTSTGSSPLASTRRRPSAKRSASCRATWTARPSAAARSSSWSATPCWRSTTASATSRSSATASPGARASASLRGAPPYFGLITTRHMHEHGTTLEQWAQVAVSTRKWAALNPKARNREPLTVKDVLDSRPVVWPFNILNICLVTDAGGAVLLTRADRAKDCAKKPVYVRGAGEGSEHVMLTQMRNLTFSEATRLSGEKAFAMAGVKGTDFDHIMLYDAFTSGPPLMLESLGIAKRGEGVHHFAEGRSTPGGKLPINTNGGGLSYTHSGMYGIFPIIEATRQLRHECGARQVPNTKLSLVNGMGGMLSAAGTLVLSNDTGR